MFQQGSNNLLILPAEGFHIIFYFIFLERGRELNFACVFPFAKLSSMTIKNCMSTHQHAVKTLSSNKLTSVPMCVQTRREARGDKPSVL
jgi:hypothetical protein